MKKYNKTVGSVEELKAYIQTLPEDAREEAESMLANLEGRMFLSAGIGKLLIATKELYPEMEGNDGLSALAAILAISSTSNLDRIIIGALFATGVMDIIKEITEKKMSDLKDTTGNSTIDDILKDFKFSDN